MIERLNVTNPGNASELLGALAIAREVYYEQLASNDALTRSAARVALTLRGSTTGHAIPRQPIEQDFTIYITDEHNQPDGTILVSGRTADTGEQATIRIPSDLDEAASLSVVTRDEPIIWGDAAQLVVPPAP